MDDDPSATPSTVPPPQRIVNDAGSTLRNSLSIHFLLCGTPIRSLNRSGLRGRILQIIPPFSSNMFSMAKAFSKVLFNFPLLSLLSDREEALKQSWFSIVRGLMSPGSGQLLGFCCPPCPSHSRLEQGRAHSVVTAAAVVLTSVLPAKCTAQSPTLGNCNLRKEFEAKDGTHGLNASA